MSKITQELSFKLMQAALNSAVAAGKAGEVPVGAVISDFSGNVISSSHNLVEQNKDATAHAEVLAIRKASETIGDWRLDKHILTVTLEPCSMCLGAIKLARIPLIIFGAFDPEKGACGSLFDLSLDKRLGAETEVISGVMENECANILKDFFRQKRKGS